MIAAENDGGFDSLLFLVEVFINRKVRNTESLRLPLSSSFCISPARLVLLDCSDIKCVCIVLQCVHFIAVCVLYYSVCIVSQYIFSMISKMYILLPRDAYIDVLAYYFR